MGDQTSPDQAGSAPAHPFPSRKDVHGSRIPRTDAKSAETAQTQAPDTSATGTPAVQGPTLREALAAPPLRSRREIHGGKPVAPVNQVPPATPAPAQTPARVAAEAKAAAPPPRRRSVAPAPQQAAQPQAAPPQTTGQMQRPTTAQLNSIALIQSKKRKRRRAIRTTLILLILVGLVGAAVWFALSSLRGGTLGSTEADDYTGSGTGSVEVTVDPDDLGSDIATKLHEAGVVKSEAAFIRAFNNNSASVTIRPGTYSLRLQMSAASALAAMLDEANRRDNTITVNAGQTVAQIKERLTTVGGFSAEDVDAALNDPAAIGLPEVAGGNPEGWLAAGAYEVGTSDTATTVISQMVAKQVQTLTDLGVPEAEWMPVLIKASILEREAGASADLSKVARVIENRLEFTEGETRGLLQMDSTVLYGVGKSGGIPTREELQDDNPYNTYLHKGLPPGPIATPSVEAIEATLSPAEGNWLYFVTVNLDTGETLFVDTLAEQEANIELLRQWCSENEGRC